MGVGQTEHSSRVVCMRFYQWPEEGEICCIKSDSLERFIDSIKYINSACFLIENNRIKMKIAKANRVPANGVNISS